jgi:hypothetical protein
LKERIHPCKKGCFCVSVLQIVAGWHAVENGLEKMRFSDRVNLFSAEELTQIQQKIIDKFVKSSALRSLLKAARYVYWGLYLFINLTLRAPR